MAKEKWLQRKLGKFKNGGRAIQLINIQRNIIAYFYSLKFLKQAYLRDIAVSVPEHCNKKVTWIFGFPGHIKVILALCGCVC